MHGRTLLFMLPTVPTVLFILSTGLFLPPVGGAPGVLLAEPLVCREVGRDVPLLIWLAVCCRVCCIVGCGSDWVDRVCFRVPGLCSGAAWGLAVRPACSAPSSRPSQDEMLGRLGTRKAKAGRARPSPSAESSSPSGCCPTAWFPCACSPDACVRCTNGAPTDGTAIPDQSTNLTPRPNVTDLLAPATVGSPPPAARPFFERSSFGLPRVAGA